MILRQLELSDAAGNAYGSLNGATSVEVVPAPAAGFTRQVRALRFVNKDSAAVDIRLRVTIAGPTYYEIDNALALAVDGKFFPIEGSEEIRLTTSESLTAVMAGAAATTNPTYFACWVDVPETV